VSLRGPLMAGACKRGQRTRSAGTEWVSNGPWRRIDGAGAPQPAPAAPCIHRGSAAVPGAIHGCGMANDV
jgi:hypothetical protein